MDSFTYCGHRARIVFGLGSSAFLEREMQILGAKRIMIVSTPGQAARAAAVSACLGPRAVGHFARAATHVPAEIVGEARAEATSLQADCVVAFGGGSAIGLGKAIALELDVVTLAIPTTYAGSEVTPIYGLTEHGVKRTGTDDRVLPRTVIYDPELTLEVPPAVAFASGMNAIAHAAEGLYSRDVNPITSLLAEEGIRSLASTLPVLRCHPTDVVARTEALYGAWLCGTVLGQVGMALHHKLCHTIGGSFNLPHAEVHTAMLPQTLRYNGQAAPRAMGTIARAIGRSDAAGGVFDLAKENHAQMALRNLGMKASELDAAAQLACANPYWNPRPIHLASVRELLQRAFEGVRP